MGAEDMGNESGQESPISAYFRGAGECCQYRAFGPHPGVLLGGVFFFFKLVFERDRFKWLSRTVWGMKIS